MARGPALSTAAAGREQVTRTLFSELAGVESREEGRRIVAELVTVNLPLADALAGRYVGRGVEREDLVQVARTALLLAIRRFHPSHGVPFGVFAVPTITGELKRYFRDHGWVVRPPRPVQELRARVMTIREQAEQQSSSSPGVAQLGEQLNMDRRRIAECLAVSASFRPLSLDAGPADRNGFSGAGQLAADGDLAEQSVQRHDLRVALAQLSPRDRQVLVWRFRDECSQREIGERLGVSQMQVSRILRRVLGRVRAKLSPAEPMAS